MISDPELDNRDLRDPNKLGKALLKAARKARKNGDDITLPEVYDYAAPVLDKVPNYTSPIEGNGVKVGKEREDLKRRFDRNGRED